MLANGKGGVIESTVFEKILFAFLQFDDEFLTAFVLAIEIEDGLAVDIGVAELFGLQVGQITDLALLLFVEFIEEIEEQVFVLFYAEGLFEAVIGEQIDVAFLGGHDFDGGARFLILDLV